jgi:TP901 family phage tail tape measure protein
MASNDLKLRVLFDLIDGATKPLRNIMSGNQDLAKSLKETRASLKELGQAQKDVTAFRDMKTTLAGTSTELAAAQAKVNTLAAAMNGSTSATKDQVREFERAKAAAAALRTQHDQQAVKVQELRTKLAGAGIDTGNLAQHQIELRSSMAAANATIAQQQTQLSELAARERKLADAREKMKATQEAAARLAGTGAGMAAAGAATTAPILASVAAYAKAEDSATQLQVALMRAGSVVPPEFEKINGLAMKLGDKLPGTTSDFQDMMTMLNRQGISAQTILGGMGEATAYLAVQLKKTPAGAAEFAAKLQDATRTSEADMMSLMDVIQKTFYLGVDDNNMLQGFAKLSPAMDTLRMKGLAGAKALAPLLVMADQAGMKGEAAGNAFRKIFQMSLDKDKVSKANKMLKPGQQLDFSDGKGEFGGLDKMYQQFDKLKGLTTQDRLAVLKKVFGDDAETLQAVALLMEKGVAGYQEVQGKMDSQASLQERVDKQLGTLQNLWEATTGTFTNGMVALGESIAPEVKAVTVYLGELAQTMSAWAKENPGTANAIMKTAAIIGILLTVCGGLLLALAAVMGPMAIVRFGFTALGLQGGILFRVLGMAATAVRVLSAALLTNPIGLAVTAIALAAFLIYQYWEPISGFFSSLWQGITAFFTSGLVNIGTTILNWSPLGLFYQAFAGVMSWFGIEMPATFTQFGANILAGLVNGILGGLGAVRDAIVGVAESTVGWFKEKLGIHSPSRVFAELGGFVGDGAAEGIDDSQKRVANATKALAGVAVAAFGMPGMAGAAGMAIDAAVPIDTRAPISAGAPAAASAGDNIQIIIQGGGLDPQAIAQAVAAELDRRDRAKQSRIGSRLSD